MTLPNNSGEIFKNVQRGSRIKEIGNQDKNFKVQCYTIMYEEKGITICFYY